MSEQSTRAMRLSWINTNAVKRMANSEWRVVKRPEALIARVRSGDDEAFKEIFDRYSRPVISFIYNLVGCKELAEELMQETFVRAYRAIDQLRDDAQLSTWLFGIARNVVRESLRARRPEVDSAVLEAHSDYKPLPEAQLLNKELNAVIEQALATLDEDKRLVFTLKVFQQVSYEEIAEITGFTMAKLKTDLHRARVEMRRLLRQYYGEVRNEV